MFHIISKSVSCTYFRLAGKCPSIVDLKNQNAEFILVSAEKNKLRKTVLYIFFLNYLLQAVLTHENICFQFFGDPLKCIRDPKR